MPLCCGASGSVRAEQEDVVGVLRLGRPDLLAVDHPLVAVELGPGLERGAGREPGVRLGEALAPGDLAAQDLRAGSSSSAPRCPTRRIVGPTSVSPKKSARMGALSLANSSFRTTRSMSDRPAAAVLVRPGGADPAARRRASASTPCGTSRAPPRSSWNPGSPQPSGRFSSSQARTSERKASASGG